MPPRHRSKTAERPRRARGAAPSARTPRDPSRRRRILDAARRHFTRFGVQRTSLDAVAADVGCAKGSLYLEFADKTALLREVLREVQHEFAARFAAEVAALPSPLARLRETLRFAYRAMASEPLFERLLREDPELTALRGMESADERAAGEAQLAMLRGWVDEGVRRGEIRADVDRDAVPFVMGALRFAPQHLAGLRKWGMPSEQRVLDAIVDGFVAGLAAPTRPANANANARAKTGRERAANARATKTR